MPLKSEFIHIKQRYTLDQIIVISPGSSTFKIGFASVKEPVAIPAIYAVRKNVPHKKNDVFLSNNNYFNEKEKEIKNKSIKKILKMEIYSRYIDIPTSEQIKNEEKYDTKDYYTEEDIKFPAVEQSGIKTEKTTKPQFLFGENAKVDENEPYEIRSILKNGFLNIEKLSNPILSDIVENFFLEIISSKLNISKKEYKDFCIAFVLPITFCRSEIMFFIDIFLERLKFKAILFHLEPVLSCFGTGFSGACVVDIGAETTKISCVQYGSIVLQSRIVLPFGCQNIKNLLIHCMTTKSLNEFNCPLQKLKENTEFFKFDAVCEKLMRELCVFPKKTRHVRNAFTECVLKKKDRKSRCSMTLSNAIILPPLGLFYPEIFLEANSFKRKKFKIHDSDKVFFEYESSLSAANDEMVNYTLLIKNESTKLMIQSLDSAIITSLINLPKLEDRMSMATSILLVGGGAKINGFSDFLEEKVKQKLLSLKSSISTVEILPRRDEKEFGLSPEFCSWLGMSIVCGNEGCKEMWITKEEWAKSKCLLNIRNRLPFELEVDIVNHL